MWFGYGIGIINLIIMYTVLIYRSHDWEQISKDVIEDLNR